MVVYILAIGLLVAGVVWYLYGGLGQSGAAVDAGGTTDTGAWGQAGNLTRDPDGNIVQDNGGHTGYRPPSPSAKVTGNTHPPSLPPPTGPYVPPSTGPKIQARRGVGAF